MNKETWQMQKDNAVRRHISFELTFEEWRDVWKRSRRWSRRGRGKGKYCMSRFNDEGAYKIGNVKICLFENNNREQKPSEKQKAAIRLINQTRIYSKREREKLSQKAKKQWRSGNLTGAKSKETIAALILRNKQRHAHFITPPN